MVERKQQRRRQAPRGAAGHDRGAGAGAGAGRRSLFARAGRRGLSSGRFTPDLVDAVIDAAASARVRHDAGGCDAAVSLLALGPSGPDGAAVVDRALGLRLLGAVTDAWARGWQPADLARVAQRQLARSPARLVACAVVRELRSYAPAAVPARWRDQVDDLDPGDVVATRAAAAATAGVGDSRWAVAGQGVERPSAVRVAVDCLAFLQGVPRVPKLGPAPGEAAASAASGGGVDARVLHRVRGLLAKAESTTFPDEAEALTAKAQELMARHAIDAAVVAAERGRGPDVGGRRLSVDDPYAGAKAILVEAIASANRCRSVWSKDLGYATVFGDDGDLDAVELLYTSLLVQAARAMFAPGAGARRASAGSTRAYRQSFLVSFASRIGDRLRQAVEAATDAYADQHATLLPVLASRRVAAEAACDESFPRVRPTTVSANDRAGWRAGREAADAAQLDVHTSVTSRASA